MRTLGEVAREMRENKNWSKKLQKEFCEITGIVDKWNKANKEGKVELIYEEADNRNVDVEYSEDVVVKCKYGWSVDYHEKLKNMDRDIREKLYGMGYETEQDYYTAYEKEYNKKYNSDGIVDMI